MSQSHFSKKSALHGQIIGHIWHKTADSRSHMLRKPPAWAVDVQDLDTAERAGVTHCEITDIVTGTHYRAELAHIRAAGFKFNRGAGWQIGLALLGWIRIGPALPDLPPTPEPQKTARPAQMSLFGG